MMKRYIASNARVKKCIGYSLLLRLHSRRRSVCQAEPAAAGKNAVKLRHVPMEEPANKISPCFWEVIMQALNEFYQRRRNE